METIEGVHEGLRERKKERTRDAIRDAARDLFAERGYVGTTVDDISAAADVSPRTFFRYFPNKEEVLFSRFDDTLDLLGEFLDGRPAGEPIPTSLRAASEQFASVGGAVNADRATFDIFFSTELLHARYLQSFFHLESMVTSWMASRLGVPPEDLLPRTLAAVLASGARVALDVWIEQPGRDLHDILDVPLRMIDSALSS